jgi:hypothetical protein
MHGSSKLLERTKLPLASRPFSSAMNASARLKPDARERDAS